MGRVRRWVRVASWGAAVLVLVVIAALVFVGWTVRRSFPQVSGSIDVHGLRHPVTVIRDAQGIPQIYARDTHDLFLAQGFVQAQDRFFQMDFRRHVTAGRLSQLFGRSALKTDEFVRTLGWRRVAQRELPLLEPSTRSYLQSYAEGVNAYLATHHGSQLSLEYAVLALHGAGYTPPPWTPVDSLSWLKAMAWDLGGNMTDEIDRALESTRLSPRQIAELYPPYPYRENRPIVAQGAVVDGVYEQNATKGGSRLPSRPPFPPRSAGAPGAVPPGSHPASSPPLSPGSLAALRSAGRAAAPLARLLGLGPDLGSNAWAIAGSRTASGAPILANDPHLGEEMPGTWYQMGLHCLPVTAACPYDVSGFTFAGMPGVVIGHDAKIAWGLTNLDPDVEDLYLEQVRGDRYRYDGRWLPLQTRTETFRVTGESEPVRMTVRTTRDGPIISGVYAGLRRVGATGPVAGGPHPLGVTYAVSLRWTALQPGRTADALFAFDRAGDWAQFRAAARLFQAPSQNLVYADAKGNIGYQAPGQIPIRRTGDGDWPVPGWDPAYDWAGYIPFDALPSVLNPNDGLIVTANQAVVRRPYPYYLGDSWDYGFRAQRIRHLLAAKPDLTVADVAAIQLDTYSQLARVMTPYLLRVRLPAGYDSAGQRLLAHWDFHLAADSAPATYFNAVWREVLALTFHDQLPKFAWPDEGSRWWAVVEQLLRRPHDSFWDNVHTSRRETRDDILVRAMLNARNDLTRILSRDVHDWQWGRLHTLTLRNPTLGSSGSPVAFLFNRGGYRVGGGPSVVNATSWEPARGYGVTVCPSMRMVIPLDDLDAARWINLTGESGHAYDSHYTDQTALWASGRTLRWAFSRSAVRRAAADTLTLRPTAKPTA